MMTSRRFRSKSTRMETEELQEDSPLTGEQTSRRKDPWKSRRKVQQKSCGKNR